MEKGGEFARAEKGPFPRSAFLGAVKWLFVSLVRSRKFLAGFNCCSLVDLVSSRFPKAIVRAVRLPSFVDRRCEGAAQVFECEIKRR